LSVGPQVLVCDDEPSVRHLVSRLLEREGYRVLVAASGREAVDLASTHRPSAVLLDMVMPGMSGWETMSALRAHPSTAEIPIVVLSALQPTKDQAGLANGADAWVNKPFEKKTLFAALKRVVNESSRPARILLVEDDPDLAQVITASFQDRGVETYYAQSGKEAIELSQSILPDLVILDLVLPEGDGFTVVNWLRRHDALRNVALVVYSVRDLSEEEREHLKLGHTEFITKGRVAPAAFQERVIRLLDHVVPNRRANLQ
jgi:CheY-like chemotaxis protein